MSVSVFLGGIAAIFLIGTLGEVVFRRTQIPDVVWLIAAGLVVGPIGGLVDRAQLRAIAPYFAAITIIVVLFDGGSRLRFGDVARSAARSLLLAGLTFLGAVLVVMVLSMGASAAGWLPAAWTWTHGALLGCILGGSSSIIIMPAMERAGVEPAVANLVSLESAFTDALCVVGATALIDVLVGGPGASASPAWTLLRSSGIGLGIGAAGGALWLLGLGLLRGSEHAWPITFAALLLLYVLVDHLHGSAALAILTFAILVGNARSIGARLGLAADVELSTDVRGVQRQIAFLVKSFFFTFIGAMLGPPWSLLALGLVLGGALLGARLPGVLGAMAGRAFSTRQRRLALVSLPRGMAAGVLATMPGAAGVSASDGLPAVVFSAVLTTILIFAVAFPLVRRGGARPAPAQAPAPPGDDAHAAEGEVRAATDEAHAAEGEARPDGDEARPAEGEARAPEGGARSAGAG